MKRRAYQSSFPVADLRSSTARFVSSRHRIGSRPGKTRLLRFVESIGYWSMLDVLVVALVTALIQFKAVGTAEPRLGIVFFGAVVVLTMLAAMSFDGRLTWDEGSRHE